MQADQAQEANSRTRRIRFHRMMRRHQRERPKKEGSADRRARSWRRGTRSMLHVVTTTPVTLKGLFWIKLHWPR
jgi:hypothetical protein